MNVIKNETELNKNNVYKKTHKLHWEIVVIIILLCASILFAFLGSSDTLKKAISDSTKTTLTINTKDVQRAKSSVIGSGNQYLSETYLILLKVQGVEQVTIDGKTGNYAYVNFPPSMIPNNSIFGYFNASPNEINCLKWVQQENGLYYQLQVIFNGNVLAYNTYYSGISGNDYRWYITEFNFVGINTPAFFNYQGDVETNYYTAFFSLLCQTDAPIKCNLLNVASIGSNYMGYLNEITNLNDRIITTWQYYQLQSQSDFYQQGYEVGYGKGNEDGYNDGLTSGQNNVLNNPNTFGLYSPQQYQDYGNTKFEEGKSSIPSSADKDGFKWLMGSILNAPYNIFSGILNFEIFGINLFSVASFIITALLIMFIVKLILSR